MFGEIWLNKYQFVSSRTNSLTSQKMVEISMYFSWATTYFLSFINIIPLFFLRIAWVIFSIFFLRFHGLLKVLSETEVEAAWCLPPCSGWFLNVFQCRIQIKNCSSLWPFFRVRWSYFCNVWIFIFTKKS